jgi:hypothetical protein
MQSEARAAGLERVKVVSHVPAEDFYYRVGAVRTGTAFANPPAVPWDRPEFEFRILPGRRGVPVGGAPVAGLQESLDAAG